MTPSSAGLPASFALPPPQSSLSFQTLCSQRTNLSKYHFSSTQTLQVSFCERKGLTSLSSHNLCFKTAPILPFLNAGDRTDQCAEAFGVFWAKLPLASTARTNAPSSTCCSLRSLISHTPTNELLPSHPTVALSQLTPLIPTALLFFPSGIVPPPLEHLSLFCA